MKKCIWVLAAFVWGCTLVSCHGKKDEASSAQDSAQVAASDEPYADPDLTNTSVAKLGGRTFIIEISRKADKALPVVTDELGKGFYANRVEVTITREGEPFFSKIFTKETFSEFLSSEETKGTVLLGMAFDSEKSDGHAIRLGAQVGQVGIEEGPAFSVEIPLDGSSVSIVRDKNQDTTGDDGLSD